MPIRKHDEEFDIVFKPSESSSNYSTDHQITESILIRSTDKISLEITKNPVVEDLWEQCSPFRIIKRLEIGFWCYLQANNGITAYNNAPGVPLQAHCFNFVGEGFRNDWCSWFVCELHRHTVHEELLKIIINHLLNDWCTMINRHLTSKSNHLRTQPMLREATESYKKTRTCPKKGVNKYDKFILLFFFSINQ